MTSIWKVLLALLLISHACAFAAPNLNGETGYINMPNGRIEQDATLRMGYRFSKPYVALWSSVSVLPRLEISGRYERIMTGAIGANSLQWQGYGDYKDKVLSGKLLLLSETEYLPSVALGMNDVQGTGLFAAQYIAANKQFGALDVGLGYGRGRIAGGYVGARYTPAHWGGFALVSEYDANRYRQDLFANQTGVLQRRPSMSVGAEYRWGWLAAQLSYRTGATGINVCASIPLDAAQFVPKINEPQVDAELVERPSFSQWQSAPHYEQETVARLLAQDFKNIELRAEPGILTASLSNTRIAQPERAVERAARSLVLRAPLATQTLWLHYKVNDLPVASYHFSDVPRLQQYFEGEISRQQLAPFVSVSDALPDKPVALRSTAHEHFLAAHLDGDDGDMLSFRAERAGLDKVRVAPGLGVYFNDPSGALRYDAFLNTSFDKQLARGLTLSSALQLTLYENVSGVRQLSNSALPHVRSDVASYKKSGKLKLNNLLLNQFLHPAQGVYARASAGLYEEMFGGVGGQILYAPSQSPWAIDFSVDAVRQRDVGGGFAWRNYQTTTTLAALHWRLPLSGVTATVRAGQFLAKDQGARFELRRRFRSGFELGVWYTLTNGHDITTPGSPTQPYHDKGVSLVIALDAMLTKDTQAKPAIAFSPWTRDVGQMLVSPSDLYELTEPVRQGMYERAGQIELNEAEDRYLVP
jgi:Exopolysaccharide biosynthesis protein YbjH